MECSEALELGGIGICGTCVKWRTSRGVAWIELRNIIHDGLIGGWEIVVADVRQCCVVRGETRELGSEETVQTPSVFGVEYQP